jgi:hypothetical protein
MYATLYPTVPTSSDRGDPFRVEIDAFARKVRDQTIVSASRCRDGLLDLYNITIDPAVRRVIELALSDIRFANAVRGDQLRATLATIEVAALVESALDGR